MDSLHITGLIKQLAYDQGFQRAGVAAAAPAARGAHLRAWLEAGRSGEMSYLQRHVDMRIDPSQLLPGARSVLVAALSYHRPRPEPPDQPAGRVAMYAWGPDYHRVVKDKLLAVITELRRRLAQPFEARACVDTAPLLERELAMQAGIGWIGKNTLVLHQDVGSYVFLGEIVTTLQLVPDAPASDHCGSCTRCLDACPTQAFPAPYEMDARRCIAYHTIERRSDIPAELHRGIGDWIFGCDVCQEVCPYNQGAPLTAEPCLVDGPPRAFLPLNDVARWTAEDYRRTLRGTALTRARLDMLQRNARIVAANGKRSQDRSVGPKPNAESRGED